MAWTPIGAPIVSLATVPDPLTGFARDLNMRLAMPIGIVEPFSHAIDAV
jgi:hypothetical protein